MSQVYFHLFLNMWMCVKCLISIAYSSMFVRFSRCSVLHTYHKGFLKAPDLLKIFEIVFREKKKTTKAPGYGV